MNYVLILFKIIAFSAFLLPSYGQKNLNYVIENSCFKIECYKNGMISKTGSGFIIKQIESNLSGNLEYLAVTNEHVIENTDSVFAIFNDGTKLKSSGFIHSNHQLDASLIVISSKRKFLAVLDGLSIDSINNIDIGESIYTISSPKGLTNSLSTGVIAGIRGNSKSSLIQYTAPISHGSSGGLILNSKFKPIAIIVSQHSEGQNLNFGIPIYQFMSLLIDEQKCDLRFKFVRKNIESFSKLSDFIEKNDPLLRDIVLNIDNKDIVKSQLYNIENDYLTENLLDLKASYYLEDNDIRNLIKLAVFLNKKYKNLTSLSTLIRILYFFRYEKEHLNNISLKEIELLGYSDDDLIIHLNHYFKGYYFYSVGNEFESFLNFKLFSDYLIQNYKNDCFKNLDENFVFCMTRNRAIGTTCYNTFFQTGAYYLRNSDDKSNLISAVNYFNKGIEISGYFQIDLNEDPEWQQLIIKLIACYFLLGDKENACKTVVKYGKYIKSADTHNKFVSMCK